MRPPDPPPLRSAVPQKRLEIADAPTAPPPDRLRPRPRHSLSGCTLRAIYGRQVARFARETVVHDEEGRVWREEGAGPPVVLVHGFSDEGATWGQMIDRAGQDRRWIAVDLPGHGASAVPAEGMSAESLYAGFEAEVLDAAIPGTSLVVLRGCSHAPQLDCPGRLAREILAVSR